MVTEPFFLPFFKRTGSSTFNGQRGVEDSFGLFMSTAVDKYVKIKMLVIMVKP